MNLRLAMATAGGIFALGASCSWNGYDPASSSAKKGGAGQACDGALPTCSANLTCVANECRTSCVTDVDCVGGNRCLQVMPSPCSTGNGGNGNSGNGNGGNGNSGTCSSATQGYCVDDPSVECASGGFCPAGTMCAPDGLCRNGCTGAVPGLSSDAPCVVPETCVLDSPSNCTSTDQSNCLGYCVVASAPGGDGGSDARQSSDAGDKKDVAGNAADSQSSDGPTGPLVFLSGLDGPAQIEASDAGLAWITTSQTLEACPTSGCAIAIPVPGAVNVFSFALTLENYVYWDAPPATAGSPLLQYCSPSGTCGRVTTGAPPAGLAAVGGDALVLAAGPSALDVCATTPICNSPVSFATTNGNVMALAAGVTTVAEEVFWSSGGAVFECPLDFDACTPTPVQSPGTPTELAVTSAGAYAVINAPGSLALLSLNGMPDTIVPSDVTHVAADDRGVYWTTATGQVETCSGPPCTPVTIVDEGNGMLGGVAINSTHVFWTVTSGARAGTIRYASR